MNLSLLRLPYRERVRRTAPGSLTAYWALDDLTGTPARDLSVRNNGGLYAAAGVTRATPGIDGVRGVTMSGADTYVNIPTDVNTFDTDWNGNRYSLVAWGRVDGAARWTDAASFRYLTHIRAADATYYTVMGKTQTDNQLTWRRRVGGPIVEVLYTFSPAGPLDWFCMGMTVDQSLPLMICYLYDTAGGFREVGRSSSASLAAWTGNEPQTGTTVLGAGSLTLQEWFGALDDNAVWCGAALTAPQMRQVMVP